MRTNESFLRDILRIIVWYPIRWIILSIPIYGGIKLIGFMGDIDYAISINKRKRLNENLLIIMDYINCYSESMKKHIKEYFRNHYIDRLMIFLFPRFKKRNFTRFVEIKGLEYVDKALQSGKGVILVHGHFGPVHLPLVVLTRLGYQINQIGMPSDEGLSLVGRVVSFKIRMKYEAKLPAEIVRANGFLRVVFKWLKDNRVIMITGDGSGRKKKFGRHEIFKFFGHSVMFPLGPAILARKTGAKLLYVFVIPGEKKLYKIIIEKGPTTTKEYDEDIENATKHFIKRLESYVSKYPGFMHFLDIFCPGQLIV